MTAPIGPGDYVECVSGAYASTHGDRLVKGRVYRVDSLVEIQGGCRFCGAYEEVGFIVDSDIYRTDGWCPKRFKPVYRRKAGAFDHLLQPTDEKVPA